MKHSLAPLCIAVVATIVAVQSVRRTSGQEQHAHESAAAVVPCTNELLALLGGLDVGHELAEWRVMGIRCIEPKGVEIDLLRDSTPLALIVAERGSLPHSPPRQTSRHDLFYTRQTPPDAAPTQNEIFSLLTLLGARVEQAEQSVGSPGGRQVGP